jgi:DNA repair protein RadC
MLIRDEKKRITAVENMGEGTVGASEVYPRKLLEVAIKNKAKSIILAHNHPHGGPTASDDDIEGTKRLKAIFSKAGIELAVHYVVSGRAIKVVEEKEKSKKTPATPAVR